MDIKTVIDLEKQRKQLKKSRKLWKILSYLVALAAFGPMLALALIIIFLDFPKLDLGVENLFLCSASKTARFYAQKSTRKIRRAWRLLLK